MRLTTLTPAALAPTGSPGSKPDLGLSDAPSRKTPSENLNLFQPSPANTFQQAIQAHFPSGLTISNPNPSSGTHHPLHCMGQPAFQPAPNPPVVCLGPITNPPNINNLAQLQQLLQKPKPKPQPPVWNFPPQPPVVCHPPAQPPPPVICQPPAPPPVCKPPVHEVPADDIDCGPLPLGDANARTQARQLREIAEGVRNGTLTPQEAQRLLQQQENIAKATEQAMADGKLTREEALRLKLLQAGADLNIHLARNNGQRSFGASWDSVAREQANQLERIAKGRANGTITAGEATELLDAQEDIADLRGDANTGFEKLLLSLQQTLAGANISFHSLPGDQNKWSWNFLPQQPALPVNSLPRPRPELSASALHRSVIVG
jgi:hypothetical protein